MSGEPRHMGGVLCFGRAEDLYAHLADEEGRPVWPVASPEDLERLRALAGTFEAELREAAVARAGQVSAGGGQVAALGGMAERPARLYAHLTGRRFAGVVEGPGVRGLARVEVLVASYELVTDALLRELCGDGGAAVLGLVCASDEESLRRQVLTRAAAAWFPPRRGSSTSLNVLPDLPLEVESVGPGHVVLGRQATPAQLAEHLSRRTDCIAVLAHSDGIDAKLGAAALCGMNPEAKLPAPPYCQISGECYRHQLPVTVARERGLLISPDMLRTRLLIMNVCDGFRLPGYVIDHRWGYTARLLDSPTVGALLTTWYTGMFSLERQEIILGLIADGLPIGEAAARFVGSELMRQTSEKVILFGDPRLVVQHPEEEEEAEAPGDTVHSAAPAQVVPAPSLSDVSLLRAMVHQALPLVRGAAADTGREVLGRLDRVEHGLWQGDLEATLAAVQESQRLLAQFFVEHTTWLSLSMAELSHRQSTVSEGPCPHCGRPALTECWELRQSERRYRVVVCPWCRLAAESPWEAPVLSVSVGADRSLYISGELPSEGWFAAAILDPPQRKLRQKAEWPSDSQGRPVRSFTPPFDWPPGPMHVTLMLAKGLEVSMFRQQVRLT